MNLITYTPAPWAVGKAIAGEPAVVKRDGDDVTILAIVTVNGDGDTDGNARLMASAPALLKALDDLMVILTDSGHDGDSPEIAVACTIAESVIADALGIRGGAQ